MIIISNPPTPLFNPTPMKTVFTVLYVGYLPYSFAGVSMILQESITLPRDSKGLATLLFICKEETFACTMFSGMDFIKAKIKQEKAH